MGLRCVMSVLLSVFLAVPGPVFACGILPGSTVCEVLSTAPTARPGEHEFVISGSLSKADLERVLTEIGLLTFSDLASISHGSDGVGNSVATFRDVDISERALRYKISIRGEIKFATPMIEESKWKVVGSAVVGGKVMPVEIYARYVPRH